jgi:hypothetical protein
MSRAVERITINSPPKTGVAIKRIVRTGSWVSLRAVPKGILKGLEARPIEASADSMAPVTRASGKWDANFMSVGPKSVKRQRMLAKHI